MPALFTLKELKLLKNSVELAKAQDAVEYYEIVKKRIRSGGMEPTEMETQLRKYRVARGELLQKVETFINCWED